MTQATRPVVPPTAPDDVPSAAPDQTAREGVIRDLYALAAFYVANPTHPLPTSIQVHHYVTTGARLQTVANRWAGSHVYGSERQQCDHDLPNTSMSVSMIVAIPSNDRPL